MLLGALASRPSDDVLLVPAIAAERTGKHARPRGNVNDEAVNCLPPW